MIRPWLGWCSGSTPDGSIKMKNKKRALKQLREFEKYLEKKEKPRLAAEGWNQDWKVLISIILYHSIFSLVNRKDAQIRSWKL